MAQEVKGTSAVNSCTTLYKFGSTLVPYGKIIEDYALILKEIMAFKRAIQTHSAVHAFVTWSEG